MLDFYLLSLVTALGAAALYCAGLYCSHSSEYPAALILITPVIFISATIAAHFSLAAPGHISLLALPAGWALAFGPHYFYSHHIERPSFFGRKFTFHVLGALYLAPPLAVSLLLALLGWLRR